MLLIRCPYCEEERPELEFRNAGEAHVARSTEMASISDDDFEKFFFIRSNPKGIIFERWRTSTAARFFNVARDTVTDKFWSPTRPASRNRPGKARVDRAGRLCPAPADQPMKKPRRACEEEGEA